MPAQANQPARARPERLAGSHSAGPACRVELMEHKQPNTVSTRLDQ